MPKPKTNSFAAAMKSKDAPKEKGALEQRANQEMPKSAKPAAKDHERPSRRGTKHIGGYFDPAVSKQLRLIALEEDTSVQALLAEAIDIIFHARRKPTIAEKAKG